MSTASALENFSVAGAKVVLGFKPRATSFKPAALTEITVECGSFGKAGTMKDFKKLLVWRKAMDIVSMVFDIYEDLPWQKAAELKAQSIRAAISIASNIAEGNSRRSEKEKLRYMEIALGSAFELETQTLCLRDRPWGPKERSAELLSSIEEVQKMLSAFMSKLNTGVSCPETG